MWTTPGKTTVITTALPSPRNIMTPEKDEDLPYVLNHPRYHKLFTRIYQAQEKAYKSIDEEEEEIKKKKILESITEKLKRKELCDSFHKKFSLSCEPSKKQRIHDHHSVVGITKLEEDEMILKDFLLNYKKAAKFQQERRLVEYRLKDLEGAEQIKTKIGYIDKVEILGKHRRLSTSRKKNEKWFLNQQEQLYLFEKKKAFIKNDEQLCRSLRSAKQNPVYRRAKNYAQIFYMKEQTDYNLIHDLEKQHPGDPTYNQCRKLFLHYAVSSQSHRIYYDYIDTTGLGTLINAIVDKVDNYKVTRESTSAIIDSIMKYKYRKAMQFGDFREFLQTIDEQFKVSVLGCFREKAPELFESGMETYQQENAKAIESFLKKGKYQIWLKMLFETEECKIVGKHYLPLSAILELMKKAKIVPKTITMCKFIHTCLWEESRMEGFSFNEFSQIQINLALSLNCSLEGIEEYLLRFSKLVKFV